MKKRRGLRQRNQAVRVVTLAAGISMFLTACGGEVTSDETERIVFGLPIAESGGLSAFDMPMAEGARIAVEEINEAGGLLGQELDIITANHRAEPNEVARAAQEVIAGGADFLIPSQDYDLGSPAARLGAEQEDPMTSISSAGDGRFGLHGIGSTTFNVLEGTSVEGAAAAAWAHDEMNLSRPYILGDTANGYARSLAESFKFSWEELGGTIIGEDTFDNADTSVATQIDRIKSAEPDLVFLASYPPGGSSALRQIRAAGVTVPIFTGLAFGGTSWIEGVDDPTNFFSVNYGLTTGDDPSDERDRIVQAYRDRAGEDPITTHGLFTGYVAVQLYAKAIEEVGAVDRAQVNDTLETFNEVPTVLGPITWTPDCHITKGQSVVISSFTDDGVDHFVTELTPDPTIVDTSAC